jgi:hypothetical protein
MMAFRAAATHLDRMQREGFISQQAWEGLRAELLSRAEDMARAVRELQQLHPDLTTEELATAHRELTRAQRGALLALRRDGIISEEVFEKLVAEVDAEIVGETNGEGEMEKVAAEGS